MVRSFFIVYTLLPSKNGGSYMSSNVAGYEQIGYGIGEDSINLNLQLAKALYLKLLFRKIINLYLKGALLHLVY